MLSEVIKIKIRFSEIDSLKIVWHGNYLRYMEDAREAFCNKFGLGYRMMYEHGYMAPLYDIRMKYRGVVSLDDEIFVKITYVESKGGRLMFDYEMTNANTGEVIFSAETTQLFMTLDGTFSPAAPDFFVEWKQKNGLRC